MEKKRKIFLVNHEIYGGHNDRVTGRYVMPVSAKLYPYDLTGMQVLYSDGKVYTDWSFSMENIFYVPDNEIELPVYISGPIESVGIDKARENFARAEQVLRAKGYINIVNPTTFLTDEQANRMDWEDIMRFDLRALTFCAHIAMLHTWEQSHGASIEHHFAQHEGLNIMYINSEYELMEF